MKRNFSKFFIFFVFLGFFSAAFSFSQQITKFAVVDTSKVYQAYFRNSAPVRNYENKKEEFKREIDRLVAELQNLNDQKIEYERNGNDSEAMRLEAKITKKADFINEYTNAKNTELESLKKSLQDNNAFYKDLYDTLARVAETGGYSMILNLQESNSVLWYSPSVDITEQVIAKLGLR
ncbi:OmpH family outer membrane protein [Treponema sp.]|uniref:OmpH family outer membrane protein n=1 Tax=Treponema sp. TaxID=166 RepID=UPI003F0ED1A8